MKKLLETINDICQENDFIGDYGIPLYNSEKCTRIMEVIKNWSTWIKCEDSHPPIGKQVLAYGPNLGELIEGVNFEICVWDGDQWWNEGGTESSYWDDPGWTHWMELPSPPSA